MDEKTKLKRMLNHLVDIQSDDLIVLVKADIMNNLVVSLMDSKTSQTVSKIINTYDSFYSDIEEMQEELHDKIVNYIFFRNTLY